MNSSLNTQRVNAAVHVAIRRAVSEMPSVGNRQALELSIGRRLQGTYGAALRALADGDPNLSAAELCQAVIFAGEYVDDITEASVYSGDRDRARKSQPNVSSPADNWPDGKLADIDGWSEGLEQVKSGLSEPTERAPQAVPLNPDFSVPENVRSAIEVGRGLGAAARRARLDRA